MIAYLNVQEIPVREWGTQAETGRQGDWNLILLEYLGKFCKTHVSELSHWRVRFVEVSVHQLQSVCFWEGVSLPWALNKFTSLL